MQYLLLLNSSQPFREYQPQDLKSTGRDRTGRKTTLHVDAAILRTARDSRTFPYLLQSVMMGVSRANQPS